MKEKDPYICPVELSGSLDNRARRWLQNPSKILAPYINPGVKILDIGCGPGFFTLEMARLTGSGGAVVAADLQQEMLEKVRQKIIGTELHDRITRLPGGQATIIPD
ncbi:MAG: methyltransferase domain-containing protein [Bacteroidales bacterium]|nr:methyltransferase domain-containing protein [Bacteroidales bacterium]